jgi:hypothetical protein
MFDCFLENVSIDGPDRSGLLCTLPNDWRGRHLDDSVSRRLAFAIDTLAKARSAFIGLLEAASIAVRVPLGTRGLSGGFCW